MNSSKKASKHTLLIYTTSFSILIFIVLIIVIFINSGDSKSVQTPPTTIETTKSAYELEFEYRISKMRSAGMNDMADRLVSLYESEPQVAYSLGYLAHPSVHPALAELLMQQPWYLDGLSDSERIFICYGLGNEEQGIALKKGIDDILERIIVNQQYVIDTVELSGGVKPIVLTYDLADDAISKESLDLTMKIVKASALKTEKLNGAKYPLNAITVFAMYPRGDSLSGASNGTIDFVINTQGIYGKNGVRVLLEEEAHVKITSRKGGYIVSKNWINEGFAQFSAEYVREELMKEDFSWWKSKWDSSVQIYYDELSPGLKQMGIWELPLSSSTLANKNHSIVCFMGFLFIKDLYDVMGGAAYRNMMSGIYDYQTAHPPVFYSDDALPAVNPDYVMVDEKILQQYALNSCPDDGVKADIQKLFDARVWNN